MGIVQKASIKLTVVIYLGAALGYLNRVLLLTNFLSSTQVGLIGILTNVAILYAQIATVGVPNISNRFFPFFLNKEKRHHGFFFWSNLVVFVGFVLTTILFVLFKPLIVKFYITNSPLIVDYYYYLIPFALASVYFQFFDSYLRAILKTVVATFLNEVFSKALITVCISLYAFKLIDFHQFVILYVVCNIVITAVLLLYIIFLKQFFIVPEKSRMYKRLLKPILVYGLFTLLGILGSSILGTIDTLMIAAKLNLSQTGIYATIFLIAAGLTFPYRSIQKITYPLVGRLWKSRDMGAVADLYKKTTLIMMITGGGIILLLWGNIDSIFRFMPGEYSIARYSLYLICIGRYADMVTSLNGIITLTSKKYKYDLFFMLILVVMTIILNLVLIPIYGITGAAMATMVSLVVYNFLRLIFVWVNFKMQPFTLNCLWIFLITIGTLVICTMCERFYTMLLPHSFLLSHWFKYVSISINSAIIVLIYMGLILFFRFSPEIDRMVFNYTGWKYFEAEKSMLE